LYQFRDPIHGFIEVTGPELKIVNSVAFQRLRNIRQLATTYLVYHGAEHTRFGHSLGVMHLVTSAFESALRNYENMYGEVLFNEIKKKWYRQILRLIALVHDLGHAPFSHASEALFDKGIKHEDLTKKIICETEIAKYICEVGENFRKENRVDIEYDITPELLWLIYGEKNPESNPKYVYAEYKFLKSFMDSDLDCDKMDYLLRDSYYCGVSYGKFDLNRLLASLNVYKTKQDDILQLAVEHGGGEVTCRSQMTSLI
jgi:HD superfamily phosphohydrolase